MTGYRHMRTSTTVEVPVSAEQFVNGAADWAESIEAFDRKTFPMKFTKCVYAPGSQAGKLPCVRHFYPDKTGLSKEEAAMMPAFMTDTLYRVDREAYVLLYSIEGEAPGKGFMGVKNYYGAMECDPLGADRCRVTLAARFELDGDIPAEPFVAMIKTVHKAILEQTAAYAKTKK